MVCKSLFSVMVNASMMKPCGLLSLRVALSNRLLRVTRLRTVRLLSPDNQLAGIRVHLVGVLVEVALHAVNLHRLRDVSGNHPVVVALFRQVLVIVESGLVGEKQRAFDVAFDSPFSGDKVKKKFVETPHVRLRFHGSVLCHVLRECQHQAFAVVEDVYLLPLLLGEADEFHTAKPVTSAHRQMNTSAKSRICRKLVSMFVNDLNSIY